jgi:type I restriction enzyme S subunit
MMFYKENRLKESRVGKIPQDWDIAKLSDVSVDLVGGGTPSTLVPDYWGGDIAWMTSAYINGKTVMSGQKYITKNGLENSATNIVPKDNLLVATRVGIGKAAVNKIDIAISQDLTGVIVDKNKVLPEFLYWCIISNEKRLKSFAQGSTIKGILREDLGRLPILRLSLPEQRAIVGVLGVVDLAVAKAGEVIAKTERLKKGLMQTLLARGIGRKEYKDTKLGRIPKDWKIEKIGDACKVVTGGTPSTQHPEYFGGNIKWLKSGDIKKLYIYDTEEKITQLGMENSNAKIHPANSVAIALSGRGQTRGRTTIIKEPMACSQSVAIMIPNPELMPEYLHYNLSNRYLEIRNLTGHLDRSGLNLSIVSDIQIPIPSVAEQEHIASVLTTIDRKSELERDEKARLERIKKGLMDLLLTGKIRAKVD